MLRLASNCRLVVLVGELGFVTPNNRRTQTVECIENGEVLTITYDRLLEIYFDNPEFGYFFLRLASDRLLQNIARLEGVLRSGSGRNSTGAAGQTCVTRTTSPRRHGNGNDGVGRICERDAVHRGGEVTSTRRDRDSARMGGVQLQ